MGNALERLQGNVRVGHKILSYLRKLPPFCRPQATAAEYLGEGIGSLGFNCAFDRNTGALESYAAMVPASANKLSWLGTFVSGLDFLSQRVAMTKMDAVSLCCVLLFVSNLESCVSIMRNGRLERAWGRKPPTPGGALALLLLAMEQRNTGIARCKSGTSRFQCFSAPWATTSLEALDRVVAAMKRRCDISRGKDFGNCTDDDIHHENHQILQELVVAFAGAVTQRKAKAAQLSDKKRYGKPGKPGMIHQHVVHALAATGLLLPLRLLEHADISNRNSNSEKLGYNGNVSVLNKNLVLWFRQELPEVSATPALIENMVCEAHRKLPPKDLFFPEQFMLRLEIVTGGERVLTRVQPKWNEDGSPGSVESRYSGPRITSAPQSFPLQHQDLSTITLNNPSGDPQVVYRVLTQDVSSEIWEDMKKGMFCYNTRRDIMARMNISHGNTLSTLRNKRRPQSQVVDRELPNAAYDRVRDSIEKNFPDLLEGHSMPPQAIDLEPLPLLQHGPLQQEVDPMAADIILRVPGNEEIPAPAPKHAIPPAILPPPRILPPILALPQQQPRVLPPPRVAVMPPPLQPLPPLPQQQPRVAVMPPPLPPLLPPLPPEPRDQMTLLSDWSLSNLPRGSRSVESDVCNRRIYERAEELHLINGDQFGPFQGTKDLLTSFRCDIQSSLKDQAFLALNEARKSKGLQKRHPTGIWYTMQQHPGNTSFTAEYVPGVCPHRFSNVGVCQLVDAIAECFGGCKLGVNDHGDHRNVWAFAQHGTAVDFLYAATIASVGTATYYQALNRKFRARHASNIRRHLEMANSSAPGKEAKSPERTDGFFVYAWRRTPNVCPDMFLVGRARPKGQDSKCVNDFSLVFPDHSFWDQWNKPRQKSKSVGRAVYIRPLPPD